MKNVLKMVLILLTITFSATVVATQSNVGSVDEHILEDTQEVLNIKYVPHNGANLEEFMKGRSLVNAVISTIIEKGFSPIQLNLNVLLSPVKMPGGMVVVEEDSILVSVDAQRDLVERSFLKFFQFSVMTEGNISFSMYNNVNSDEFLIGRDLVLSTIDKIMDTGFVLDIDKLEIGISPITMMGGDIIEKDGKIIISVHVSPDNLERYLLKFFKWSKN